MTNASDILGIDDLRKKTVHVDKWNIDVIVQEFSGADLHKVLARPSFSDGADDFDIDDVAFVCCVALHDEDGNRILTDEQAPELAAKNVNALMQIFKAALEVSGLSSEERDKEKNG